MLGILLSPSATDMFLHLGWIAAWTFLAPSLSVEAEACSLARFPDTRNPTATFFLATATSDTIRAGAGEKTFYPGNARVQDPLDAPERPIHGQVVRVDRTGGRNADAVREMAERFGGEVVVVPWGYRADCRTTTWPRSARWVETGLRGMYITRLRDPEHWVGGRPTFDAEGWHNPYPHAGGLRLEDVPEDSILTPDQFFSLYRALPEWEALQRDPEAATAPLRAWVAAHPELEARMPVPEILRYIRHSVESARVQRIVPPMRGTYRIAVVSKTGTARELFIQTAPNPSGPTHGTRGYNLHIHSGFSPDGIAEGHKGAWQHPCGRTSIEIVEEPEHTEAGTIEWTAALDWGMMARCFPEDPGIVRAVKVHAEQVRSGGWERFPGAFIQERDGAMAFEQSLRSEGEVILHIEGKRISEETIR